MPQDQPRQPDDRTSGCQLFEFADEAHEVTEEERNRPRYGRPSCPSGTPAPEGASDRPYGVAYPQLEVTRRSGTEPFHTDTQLLGFDLLSFWQWAASDLTSNTLRGWLAEYLVARALGVADGTRLEWNRYDLRSPCGATIEVKSAAYCQTWAQTRLSDIIFSIAPTYAWDSATNRFDTTRQRQADIYVFALLAHREKTTLDPLNVGQWVFLILPTKALDSTLPTQKTIGWTRLLALRPAEATYATLRDTIERVTAGLR